MRSSLAKSGSTHGRSVLLWAAALTLGVQLTASLGFDYVWPQLRYPDFYKQLARAETLPRSPDLLLLGSSRTGYLLYEPEIDAIVRDFSSDRAFTCFNAWVNAGDPAVYERLFQQLLDRGVRPRYALIEVNPEGVSRRDGWLEFYCGWFVRWDDTPWVLRDLVFTRTAGKFAESRLVPLYFYRAAIRGQIGAWACGAEAEPARVPVAQTPRDRAQWQQAIADSLRTHQLDPHRTTTNNLQFAARWFREYRVGGHRARALERVLAQCRTHGIEPILYTPPLSAAHRRLYTPEIETAFQAFVAKLTRKYACRYDDDRTALTDPFFIDHHHVGSDGATLFSRRFSVDVLAPLWSSASHASAQH